MDWVPYLVSSLITLILGFQLYMWISTKMMKGKDLPDTHDIPDFTRQSAQRSLLYFYTPNCTFCKTLSPIIEQLQQNHQHVFKINAVDHIEIAKRFSIKGVPAVILISNNKIQDVLIGMQKQQKLEQFLNDK